MILSFYSYKGGVGRTQLVANIASYLCFYKNKRVLLLEWDLEAPGLHFYFGKKNSDIQQKGLIDILSEYNELAQKGVQYKTEDLPYFTDEYIVKGLKISNNQEGTIDLIPAAKYAEPFSQKINDFDWRTFMELQDGNVYIDFLKQKLKALDYDYIFIDSRTGIADYSGLCNILMPDMNVLVVAPTEQNFEGAKKIATAIQEHPYTQKGVFRKAAILPILSRIDADAPNIEYWLERFITEFAPTLSALLPDTLNELQNEIFKDWYQPHTTLFYNRTLALGENILFTANKQTIFEGTSIKIYENIALLIERIKEHNILDIYSQLNYQLLDKWLAENKENLWYYIRIADIYNALGSLEKALTLLEEGLNEFNRTQKDDKFLKSFFYERLGVIYTSLGNLGRALEFYEEDLKITKELYATYPNNLDFKNGLAISYEKLGSTHTSLGNLDKALGFYEERSKLSKELYAAYPNNVDFKNGLAISYEKLGSTHMSLGNLDKALGFYEERSKLSKELYAAYPNNVNFKNGLAISYSKLGEIHASLGNSDKVLGFYEEYNRFKKELYTAYPNNVDFKNGLAISYEKLGNTHTALDNIEKALEFYEECNCLARELYTAYPNNVSFKNGLAISYSKLGETHTALDNLEKALRFYEEMNKYFEELYEAYKNNVAFKNGLAVSYYKLGESNKTKKDTKKAKAFFQEAEKLWLELVRDAPQYVEFQKFLKQVQEEIKALD